MAHSTPTTAQLHQSHLLKIRRRVKIHAFFSVYYGIVVAYMQWKHSNGWTLYEFIITLNAIFILFTLFTLHFTHRSTDN